MVSIYDNQSIKLESRIINRHIAVLYYDRNIDLNAEWVSPSFNQVNIMGSKLIFKDGKIFVGKNVKKVIVSASAFFESINCNNIDYIWMFIVKNDKRICNSITSGVSVYFQTSVISDYVVDVKEGDYFYLSFNNPSYKSYKDGSVRSGADNTRLFVEVLE